MNRSAGAGSYAQPLGVEPSALSEADLLRQLSSLHRTRLHTLRHASRRALVTHLTRTGELEVEYLRRHPGRELAGTTRP